MADIRSYLKEKENREQGQENYKEKIHKHHMAAVYRVLLIIIAFIILAVLVVIQYKNHIYTSYETVTSVAREVVSDSVDVRLGNTILTYSKDGAHCTDLKGNVLWNQTYGIQDVLLSVNENVAAIGAYNGREVYVVSSEKLLGSFTTNLPIRNIAVAADGKVTVVMADTGVIYYNVYTAEGKELYNGMATMSNSGYPMALSMSPNGMLLQISYIYLDAGVQKTNVAFYNLSAVGANKNDFLVGAYTYTDLVVPVVQFMNNDTSFAVGDNQLLIFKGAQIPLFSTSFNYDAEVKSVCSSDKYIGLIFRSNNSDSLYKLHVYNTIPEQVGTYNINFEYTDIFFGKDSFTVYNDAECMIMTLDGVEKFHGNFNKTVRRMIPTGTAFKYSIVTNDSIDTIQLK